MQSQKKGVPRDTLFDENVKRLFLLGAFGLLHRTCLEYGHQCGAWRSQQGLIIC